MHLLIFKVTTMRHVFHLDLLSIRSNARWNEAGELHNPMGLRIDTETQTTVLLCSEDSRCGLF